jgi:hypothetical protein
MFNAKRTRVVAAPVSVAAGVATDISDLISCVVTLAAAGTATYQGQISMDGTNWVIWGTALTASGTLVLPDGAMQFRWNCTAYTSGTPVSAVGGLKSAVGGGV